MPNITVENLQDKIALCEKQRQQSFDHANALTGAIQLAQQLLQELIAPDPPPPDLPQV